MKTPDSECVPFYASMALRASATSRKTCSMTQILSSNDEGVARAVNMLRAGDIAALPTETVYGLGADAGNAAAVAKIYAAKARPQFNPLIAHVSTVHAAEALGRLNDAGFALVEAFWPGPLTLIVNYHGGDAVCDLARAGLPTVGLRLPAHPIMRRMLEEFAKPIVAPSANRSGHVSATSAAHVRADFGESVGLILDGGQSQLGLESTIIDITGKIPKLLRAGAIDHAEIEAVLNGEIETPYLYDPEHPASPGQMSAHYATRTSLRLNAKDVQKNEALLAFGEPIEGAQAMLNLSARGDINEAATNLFAHLRMLDTSGATTIAVMPIPETGLGLAINDRLRRAAIGSGQ